jgi:hypothetical protein
LSFSERKIADEKSKESPAKSHTFSPKADASFISFFAEKNFFRVKYFHISPEET